jgi:hypothetical protein
MTTDDGAMMDRPCRDLSNAGELNQPCEGVVLPFCLEQAQALLGFRHAFLDFATYAIYLATDRDGNAVRDHSFDGLPYELVALHRTTGRVATVKPTLIAGFERNGLFYTRRVAARAAAEWLLRE